MTLRAAWLVALLACAGVANAADGKQDAPSLDAFDDAIQHWRSVHGDNYPRHAPDAVANIADNILLYQRVDGGWKENEDPARILDDETRARFAAEAKKSGGSFDNRNTYTQFDYLATAHALTVEVRRLPNSSVTRDPGSSSSAVVTSDRIGVIPDPAAIATWCRDDSGCAGHVNVPIGVMTSTTSPTANSSTSQGDIRPPATLAAATRKVPGRPPRADWQIE